jgi:HEAT repeat protein
MRYMCKFLFTRMTEPQTPSWNHGGGAWEPTHDPQDAIWRHLWEWHRGAAGESRGRGDSSDGATGRKGRARLVGPSPTRPLAPSATVAALAERLRDEREIAGLGAAYEMGTRGEAALPALLAALRDENEAAPRNAAYAFSRIGSAAVPALLEAAQDADPRVRARALDALGDMGLAAAAAVPDLVAMLSDLEEDPRRRAAEALGTAGQGLAEIAEPLGRTLASDASGEVRRNAALSLARLGPGAASAVPALAKGMMDENHYVRGFSVYALSRIGTPDATCALLKHLQSMRWDWA